MYKTVSRINEETGEREKVRVPLTEEEISQKENQNYKELRSAAYPPISVQLDAIMKWIATESEFSVPDELKSIAMKCMSVKAQYPKPDSKGEPLGV